MESTTAGSSPGPVSRGASALARVVLPLAGWPISRWQRSGGAIGNHAYARRENANPAPGAALFCRKNRSVQGWGAEAAVSNVRSPVATLNTSAARSTPRRANGSYAPPTPLQDLHILDVLELAGSQYRAGAALSMHQSTVCRSVQLMQSQFRLVRQQQPKAVCSYGHNTCLQHLRLAYREHRLMEGMLRIGTDVLHQILLIEMAGILQVPSRFRSSDHWAELVRHGLLDGAIVSSLALAKPWRAGKEPQWEGLSLLPLGQLQLQLVSATPDTRSVLLPRKGAVPLLRQAVERHGFAVEQQPLAGQEPAAWLKRARDRHLALPLCTGLVGSRWLESQKLAVLAEQPALIEQLWLLLPHGMESTRIGRYCLRQLRSQISRARTMQDLHHVQS